MVDEFGSVNATTASRAFGGNAPRSTSGIGASINVLAFASNSAGNPIQNSIPFGSAISSANNRPTERTQPSRAQPSSAQPSGAWPSWTQPSLALLTRGQASEPACRCSSTCSISAARISFTDSRCRASQ